MNLDDVFAVLDPVAAAATIGTAIFDVYKWLKGQRDHGADPNLLAALAKLPATATADDVVEVVTSFMSAIGGSVALSAGNDGGGNVHATGAIVQGGVGTTKGGDVAINAGDGGPHGKGGDITFVGGTIKGGDAA